MTEPFRGAAYPCPSCGGGLREFKQRLVCDACGGMQLADGDVATSVSDMSGALTTLTFGEGDPTGTKCPRCERELFRCRMLVSSNAEVDAEVLRCERHGVWMDSGRMVVLFTQLGRRLHTGFGGEGRSYGGVHGRGGGGGGPASRVGLLRPPKAKPRKITPYASPHEGKRLACPVCSDSALERQGDRWSCAACEGELLEFEPLVAMIGEVAGTLWEPPEPPGAPGDRACPVCYQPMLVEIIDPVNVDRCPAHGIWFDAEELAQALARAGGIEAPRGSWLRRLFFH